VSANWTVCPGLGVDGLKTNVAPDESGRTVKVRLTRLLAAPEDAMRVTLLNPELAKT
jgi:hypothetical protein